MAANKQYDHEYKVRAVKFAKGIGQAKAYQRTQTSIKALQLTGFKNSLIG